MHFFMRFLYGITAAVFVFGAGNRAVFAVEPTVLETQDNTEAKKITYARDIQYYGQFNVDNKIGNKILKFLPVDENKVQITDYIIDFFDKKTMVSIPEEGEKKANFYYFTEKEDGKDKKFYAQIIEQAAINFDKLEKYNYLKQLCQDGIEQYISEINNSVGEENCLKSRVIFIPTNALNLKKELGVEAKKTAFGPQLLWSGLCTDEKGDYVYKVVRLVQHLGKPTEQSAALGAAPGL